MSVKAILVGLIVVVAYAQAQLLSINATIGEDTGSSGDDDSGGLLGGLLGSVGSIVGGLLQTVLKLLSSLLGGFLSFKLPDGKLLLSEIDITHLFDNLDSNLKSEADILNSLDTLHVFAKFTTFVIKLTSGLPAGTLKVLNGLAAGIFIDVFIILYQSGGEELVTQVVQQFGDADDSPQLQANFGKLVAHIKAEGGANFLQGTGEYISATFKTFIDGPLKNLIMLTGTAIYGLIDSVLTKLGPELFQQLINLLDQLFMSNNLDNTDANLNILIGDLDCYGAVGLANFTTILVNSINIAVPAGLPQVLIKGELVVLLRVLVAVLGQLSSNDLKNFVAALNIDPIDVANNVESYLTQLSSKVAKVTGQGGVLGGLAVAILIVADQLPAGNIKLVDEAVAVVDLIFTNAAIQVLGVAELNNIMVNLDVTVGSGACPPVITPPTDPGLSGLLNALLVLINALAGVGDLTGSLLSITTMIIGILGVILGTLPIDLGVVPAVLDTIYRFLRGILGRAGLVTFIPNFLFLIFSLTSSVVKADITFSPNLIATLRAILDISVQTILALVATFVGISESTIAQLQLVLPNTLDFLLDILGGAHGALTVGVKEIVALVLNIYATISISFGFVSTSVLGDDVEKLLTFVLGVESAIVGALTGTIGQTGSNANPIIQIVLSLVSQLIGIIATIPDGLGSTGDSLQIIIQLIINIVIKLANSGTGPIVGLQDDLEKLFQLVINLLVSIVGTLPGVVGGDSGAIQVLINLILGILVNIVGAIPGVGDLDKLINILINIVVSIIDSVPGSIQGIGSTLQGFIQLLLNLLGSLLGSIPGLGGDVSALIQLIISLISIVIGTASGGVPDIELLLQKIASLIISITGGTVPELVPDVQTLIDLIINLLSSIGGPITIGNIQIILQEIIQLIISIIGSITSSFPAGTRGDLSLIIQFAIGLIITIFGSTGINIDLSVIFQILVGALALLPGDISTLLFEMFDQFGIIGTMLSCITSVLPGFFGKIGESLGIDEQVIIQVALLIPAIIGNIFEVIKAWFIAALNGFSGGVGTDSVCSEPFCNSLVHVKEFIGIALNIGLDPIAVGA